MLINIDKTREELAKEYFKGVGAEIGVEQGVYSEIICKANPDVKLYCVDSWRAYRGYRDHTRQSKLDRFYDITRERLHFYNCTFIRKFSVQAAEEFLDGSLDFVYIDANHSFNHVFQDVAVWTRKVKTGGIVAGHDYIRRKGQDIYYAVPQALNEYLKTHSYELQIYRGDEVPSWMFIKK